MKGYKHTAAIQARAKNANVPTLGTINPTGKFPMTTRRLNLLHKPEHQKC
jgi:hypothetical protein